MDIILVANFYDTFCHLFPMKL